MFSLVAAYDTTSSSSSSDVDTEDELEKQKDNKNNSKTTNAKPTQLLPSANILLKSGASRTASDVFNNPFLEAEKSELNKLQKHVKMVESEDHLLQKNGRKICWNNRKGRCRFGNKCKYAHDSDLVVESLEDVNEKSQETKSVQNSNKTSTLTSSYSNQIDVPTESSNKLKNQKRSGLGDNIIPGKRVMKSYQDAKNS